MQPEISTTNQQEISQQVAATLPADRSRWPQRAQDSFRHLLFELNSWSRKTDNSFIGNQWIAETAVREVWAGEGCAG